MPAGALMSQRCRIERDTSVGKDGFGGRVAPSWQPHLPEVPCRVWTEKAQTDIGDERVAVVDALRAMVPTGTDVTEADRIVEVVERSGETVRSGPLRIESVVRRRGHLELSLAEAA